MEQAEYPDMSGRGTPSPWRPCSGDQHAPLQKPIADLQLEAPAGLIGIRAECRDGKVTQVTVRNAPAFATHLDVVIDVPTLGRVTVDVGWGGSFYAIADVASSTDWRCCPNTAGSSPGSPR